MNGMNVGAATGGPSGGAAERDGFAALLADAAGGPGPVSAQSGAAPMDASPASVDGKAVRMDIGRGSAMPADEEFVLIDSVEESADGEVVVKGEAISAGQAQVAAKDGGAVILPLSEPRLGARSISGALFASMLLDQRSGALPNPFSLMRLPEPPPAPPQGSAPGTAGAIPPVSSIGAAQDAAVPDAPAADALQVGKELSRLEAAISQLIQKLEDMVRSLRTLVAGLGRDGT